MPKNKIHYWVNNEVKEKRKKTKLNEQQIEKIIQMGINKPTSEINSRKITNIINGEFEQNNIKDKNNKIFLFLNQ